MLSAYQFNFFAVTEQIYWNMDSVNDFWVQMITGFVETLFDLCGFYLKLI